MHSQASSFEMLLLNYAHPLRTFTHSYDVYGNPYVGNSNGIGLLLFIYQMFAILLNELWLIEVAGEDGD